MCWIEDCGRDCDHNIREMLLELADALADAVEEFQIAMTYTPRIALTDGQAPMYQALKAYREARK